MDDPHGKKLSTTFNSVGPESEKGGLKSSRRATESRSSTFQSRVEWISRGEDENCQSYSFEVEKKV